MPKVRWIQVPSNPRVGFFESIVLYEEGCTQSEILCLVQSILGRSPFRAQEVPKTRVLPAKILPISQEKNQACHTYFDF